MGASEWMNQSKQTSNRVENTLKLKITVEDYFENCHCQWQTNTNQKTKRKRQMGKKIPRIKTFEYKHLDNWLLTKMASQVFVFVVRSRFRVCVCVLVFKALLFSSSSSFNS